MELSRLRFRLLFLTSLASRFSKELFSGWSYGATLFLYRMYNICWIEGYPVNLVNPEILLMYDSSPMPNKITCALLFCLSIASTALAQSRSVPAATLLQITKAEDERRWDADLRNLLSSRNSSVRQRAALAAGRIGNEESVGALTNLLEKDPD